MALKPCRECTAMVSQKATFCSKCGVPKPVTAQKHTFALVLIGILVFFVLPSPRSTAEPATVPFDVSFDVNMDINYQKPIIRARTNLPEGTAFMISVANPINEGGTGYFGNYKAAVSPAGVVEFGPITNQGESLPPGTYHVSIDSGMMGLQPKNVRDILGQKGENLTGNKVSNAVSLLGLDKDIFGEEYVISQTFVFKIHQDGSITAE